MAVPMTVKMPSDDGSDAESGERDGAEGLLERGLRRSESEISLSIDFVAKIWRGWRRSAGWARQGR